MGRWRASVAAGAFAALGALAFSPDLHAAEPLRIVVTIPPLRGIVEPLVREARVDASIETLIPPGVSEHGYEIPPSRVALLAKADLVLLVGLGLEPQVEKLLAANAPSEGQPARRRVIVMAEAAGVSAEECEHEHEGEVHDHDHGDHVHATDPHIWLDPVLVEKMVGATGAALRERLADDPGAVERLRAAEAAVRERVKAIDLQYRLVLKGAERRTIVVGHDAWGHLARRYDLETVPIKGLTASEPTPAAMQAAARAVREKRVPVIFAEPQLGAAGARRLAEATGVPVRTLDPLGDGDWFALMETNLREIAGALGVMNAIPPGEKPGASTPVEK